jgi:hypothetical protein
MGLLASEIWGERPYCEHSNGFLAGLLDDRIRPPRSPDLTSPDFFLFECIKERFYSNNPRSVEDLKHNTEQAIAGIGKKNRKVTTNTLKMASPCLEECGRHFHRLL